jgi:MATE family multidrug resistance protein
MIPHGLFNAGITICGNSIGERNVQRTKLAAALSVVYQVLLCCLTAGLVQLCLEPLGEAYTNDMDVIPVFLKIMPSVFFCLVLGGLNKGLIASMRALKSQVIVTKVLAMTNYGVSLPLGYFLGVVQGYGVRGLWYGLAIS